MSSLLIRWLIILDGMGVITLFSNADGHSFDVDSAAGPAKTISWRKGTDKLALKTMGSGQKNIQKSLELPRFYG